jgi:hypothetical protein
MSVMPALGAPGTRLAAGMVPAAVPLVFQSWISFLYGFEI